MRDGNTSESTRGVSNSICSRSFIVHLQFLIRLDTSARPGPDHPLVTPSILKADAHRRVAGRAESAVHPGPSAADADLKGIGAAEVHGVRPSISPPGSSAGRSSAASSAGTAGRPIDAKILVRG